MFNFKRYFVMKINLALPGIVIFTLFCLFSCIHKKTIVQREYDPPITFQSDKYFLCTLTGDMSPSLLAKKFMGSATNAWRIEDENKNTFYKQGETIVIPRKQSNKAGLYTNGYQTIPILCYHRFSKECTSRLCIPKDTFFQQMEYLKTNKYRVISMKMLLEYLAYKKALPKKSIVITIDDGYKSVYDIAFPILKQYGFTATIFIYTNFIEGRNAMTWEQVREIKEAGFEVGSHTISHADLTIKKQGESNRKYTRRMRHEIVQSKAILDLKLNQDTNLFAFPFGNSNWQSIDICKQAGYKAGVTVNRGGNHFFTDAFMLQRDQVLSRDPTVFVSRIGTFQFVSLEDKDNE